MTEQIWPRISIVIPSYQQGQFIGQTLASLLDQHYPDLQIIVQDGGSTDQTVVVLKKFGKQIQWQSEKDKGQTDAINKGLRKTSGEIVGYLNSDDMLLPGSLSLIAQTFQGNPTCQWLTGDYEIVDAAGKKRDSGIVFYKFLQRFLMRIFPFLQKPLLSINNPIIQPSTFWRREFGQKVGDFRENLRYTMDYDWWWRAWAIQAPYFVGQKLSAFRVHQASKGGSQYAQQMAEQLKVAQKYCHQPFLLWLHQLHNFGVVWWYQRTK